MNAVSYVPDPALLIDVRKMISSEFPNVGELDAEELASEAYCTLLELARSGEEIKNPAGTIRQIARRDLLDDRKMRSAVYRTTPLAPESMEFQDLEDAGSGMLSELEAASTEARLNAIVSTLTKRQQAVFKCRYALGMSAAEAAATCKLGRSTVKREWNTALEAAMQALSGFEGDVFSRAQLKAVHAYVFRLDELAADDPQRQLVENDPATRQLALEMRESIRSQAGAIDLNATLAGLGLLAGGVSLTAIAAFIRGKLTGASASQSAGAGSAAGGGGGSLLAAGAGGKVAAGCAAVLCVGGGAAAIKATSDKDSGAKDPAPIERSVDAPPAPPSLSTPVDTRTQPASNGSSNSDQGRAGDGDGGKPGHPDDGGKPGHPDDAASGPGTNTDAAVTGEEFDPLASPAPAAPVTPAPSSTGGSSDSSSGGSSAGSNTDAAIGGSEFGP